MEELHKQIKKDVEDCNEKIAYYQQVLKDIRKQCPHTKTDKVNYSWRPGSYVPTDICLICGDVIENIFKID